MKTPLPGLATIGALLILVSACSGGSASSASPSVAALPSASVAPSATPVPTLPPDAAPAELKGRWTTLMGPGDEVLLIINDTGYSITRSGFAASGHISVTGDQIAFSRVQSCVGTGTYTWAIDANGVLTFTPVGDPDPCPRVGVLKGQAYTLE
jgi:glucose/arabinose dehydrogenase